MKSHLSNRLWKKDLHYNIISLESFFEVTKESKNPGPRKTTVVKKKADGLVAKVHELFTFMT